MIGHIGFLLEIVSILLCIHALYGEKFQLDIKAIIVIATDLILSQLVDEGKIASEMILLLYPVMFIYCIVKFGFNKKELVVNNILYIVIMVVLQAASWIVLNFLDFISLNSLISGIDNLMVNFFVFLVIVLIFPHIGLHKCSVFMQQKMFLVQIFLVVVFLFSIYLISIMKIMDALLPEHYVIIIISLCLLGGVTYMWQKNQYKVREQKVELQMHQMYGEGFQNLVTEIRKRQHDFQNHLNTIYSLHYTCSTFEELVEQQKEYGDAIQQDNKYNKLLSVGNPVIIGFLYGKFLQADKRGITIVYNIKVADLQSKMPIHKLVEIIGNLFDNAMDAVEENDVEKLIYLDFVETPEKIEFKIKNESCHIPQEQLIKMFERGESSKGAQRGLGLANVKQICGEYKCDLQVHNQKDDAGKFYTDFAICMKI